MRTTILLTALLMLAGCSRPQNMETTSAGGGFDVQEAPAPSMARVVADAAGNTAVPASGLIAYTYSLAYRLADGAVSRVQAQHAALCAALGPLRCRVVTSSLSNSAGGNGYVSGETKLLIDARVAKSVLARLDAAAAGAGGDVTNRAVKSEDLTKEIVDVDARVRAKQALADRLVKLIVAANAKVGELVEAERAYAETQQELDSARSLQAALRQRVAMSEVEIDYTSTTASGGWRVVRDSIAAGGTTLAGSLAALVTFVIAALPWALVLVALVWIARRRGWRLRFWRRAETPPPTV